jgi:hypothetical protein
VLAPCALMADRAWIMSRSAASTFSLASLCFMGSCAHVLAETVLLASTF